ncbi:MAG: 23S rRNA (pseudouridine(1915)-N(3))-methyltransferase RlmH [Bacteroidales bacterium]|nr:23S rRNA (pseudouridine(1915)-N(3))-methyltransferase RlmH [Bacteroidales bacterium]
MNIKLIVVGKTDVAFVREGFGQYQSRLKHYVAFSYEEIPALRDQKGASPATIKEREAALILKRIEGADRVVLLDEHGKEYTSEGFSEYLQKQMNAGVRTLAFVVGGAFGFAPEVYAAATDRLSLSQMTFNHQMVRLFFAEQLYRAFTILRHEPYHNG